MTLNKGTIKIFYVQAEKDRQWFWGLVVEGGLLFVVVIFCVTGAALECKSVVVYREVGNSGGVVVGFSSSEVGDNTSVLCHMPSQTGWGSMIWW